MYLDIEKRSRGSVGPPCFVKAAESRHVLAAAVRIAERNEGGLLLNQDHEECVLVTPDKYQASSVQSAVLLPFYRRNRQEKQSRRRIFLTGCVCGTLDRQVDPWQAITKASLRGVMM